MKAKEKQQQEHNRKQEISPQQKALTRHDLARASIDDLMREIATRLNALSNKTPKDRDAFMDQHAPVLSSLYRAMAPYLCSDAQTRERSIALTKKCSQPIEKALSEIISERGGFF